MLYTKNISGVTKFSAKTNKNACENTEKKGKYICQKQSVIERCKVSLNFNETLLLSAFGKVLF